MRRGPDEPQGVDDDEFAALFRREFGPVSRTVYLIVGDWEVACEIVQDAFVEVLRHWRKVRALDRPGAWVRRVAIRDAVRTRRRDARRSSAMRATMQPHETIDDAAARLDVRAGVLGLPPQQRAVVALYYLDDQPVAEIGAILGCSDGTVKTHLARGRQALADLLGAEAADEPG